MAEAVIMAAFHNWHCDHFGHVNVRHYAAVFDDAIFAFWDRMGAARSGTVPVTARLTTTFVSEATAGEIVAVHASVLRIGGKSTTVELAMSRMGDGAPLAKCETVEVFFDTKTRSSCAMPDHVRSALEARSGA